MSKAFVWMTGTVFSYTAVAVATREVSFELDTPSILFIRSISAIALSCILIGLSKDKFAQLQTSRIKLHILRNCTHFVGQFGWFFSIASIPLSHVFALEFTVPIWIALLAPIFLKEQLTLERAAYIFVGFVGILIIVQPFGFQVEAGAIAMLVGALGFASAMLATRHLLRTESPLNILFYMSILQLPISGTLLLSTGPLQIPSLVNLALIIFITAGVMFSHYCMAKAFLLVEIITVIPMEYLRLPMIAIVGALLYAEPIDAPIIIGGLAILIGNYLNVRMASRQANL